MIGSTIFGAPLGYTEDSLRSWVADLTELWLAFAKRGPGDLQADLELLRPVFGSGSTGKALRGALASLAPIKNRVQGWPEQVAIGSDGDFLMTPEGRVLLEVLTQLRPGENAVVTPEHARWSYEVALATRSRWFTEWASKQLDGNASPPVLGGVLLAYINGSVSADTAIPLPTDESSVPDLRATVLTLIGDFSEALGGRRPTITPLRTHWVFTQASRLMHGLVRRDPTPEGALLYIAPGEDDAILEELRRRLERFDSIKVRHAVDGLIDGYRDQRGLFAALGIMHESPRRTSAARSRLGVRP